MSELIPSFGCLSLFLLALPIWALREARKTKQRQELLENRLDDFSSRLKSLESRLLELKRAIRVAVPSEVAVEPELGRVLRKNA